MSFLLKLQLEKKEKNIEEIKKDCDRFSSDVLSKLKKIKNKDTVKFLKKESLKDLENRKCKVFKLDLLEKNFFAFGKKIKIKKLKDPDYFYRIYPYFLDLTREIKSFLSIINSKNDLGCYFIDYEIENITELVYNFNW